MAVASGAAGRARKSVVSQGAATREWSEVLQFCRVIISAELVGPDSNLLDTMALGSALHYDFRVRKAPINRVGYGAGQMTSTGG